MAVRSDVLRSLTREESTTSFLRNLVTCARNRCDRCGPDELMVPEGCEFGILHLFEPVEGGTREFPRMAGKTTALVSLANEIAHGGQQVCFITRTLDMARHLKARFPIHPRVILLSMIGVKHGRLNAFGRLVVLFDEVRPWEIDGLRSYLGQHQVVACYYSDF